MIIIDVFLSTPCMPQLSEADTVIIPFVQGKQHTERLSKVPKCHSKARV